TQHATLGLFTFPGSKRKLVQKNRLEALALKWTKDRFAGHLLPPRASLFISHDEILVVDTGEMKMQYASVNCRLPHQTGVTERSISCTDWRAPDGVLDHVMIGH